MTRFPIVLAILLAPSCAHTRQPAESCVTRCGLRTTDVASCAEFQRAEDRAVSVLGRRVEGWSPGEVCKAINGWTVKARPLDAEDRSLCVTGSWFTGYFMLLPGMPAPMPVCLFGYTHAREKVVELAQSPEGALSFAHELVHVVDLAKTGKAGHCRWPERGVARALNEITGVDRPTLEDCE